MVFELKLSYVLLTLLGIAAMGIAMIYKKNHNPKAAFDWVVRSLITLGAVAFLGVLMGVSLHGTLDVKVIVLSVLGVTSGAFPFAESLDGSKRSAALFRLGGAGYIVAMLGVIWVTLIS